jgi:salicylate hydroxylase
MGSIATENEATAPRPTIAILGAGIGGLGLAIGLVRQNIPFILYEAAAQFSVVGAGVGLGPNAVRAMDHIDPRLKGLYDGIKTGNKTAAKKHAVFDALMIDEGFGVNHGWPGKSIVSTAYIRTSAHRKALLDCMVSLVPEKNVRFSKRAKDVKQVGDKAEVTFYDGAKISVDILIGCDGIKGVTRKAVLGDEFPDMVEPKYSNMYFYRGIMPIAAVAGAMGEEQAGDACMFMGVGRNMTFYPISQGKEMNYIACKYDPNPWKLDQWTEEVTTEDMLKDYENIDPGLNKLMEVSLP